jgi:hypothetical protein
MYLVSRLARLTLVPIFVDESVHILWSHGLTASDLRDAVADGKLLHVIACAIPVRLAGDVLWAARFVSVLAGGLAMWAASRAAARLAGERAGLVAAALYVVCPFAFFYDRMALADVYGSAFAALAVLAIVRAAGDPRRCEGLLLGGALAAALLSKASVAPILAWPVLGFVLARSRGAYAKACAVAYAVVAAGVAVPAYLFLQWTTQFASKGADVSGLAARGELLWTNLGVAGHWLSMYWTTPLFAVGAVASAVGLVLRHRALVFCSAATLVPIIGIGLVGRDWFPRYILPATVPFLVLVAIALAALHEAIAARWRAWPHAGLAALALLCAVPALAFDFTLLTNPIEAPVPGKERFQYFTHWPSGSGFEGVVAYLKEARVRTGRELTVLVDDWGQPAPITILRAGFLKTPGIHVRAVNIGPPDLAGRLEAEARTRPTFLLLSERRLRQNALEPLTGLPLVPGPIFSRPTGVAVTRIDTVQGGGSR